jgi:hypothetical protein
MALILRRTYPESDSEHYDVMSGEVRISRIYRTHTDPDGNEWFWGVNGVLTGPIQFNGFARTLDDAKTEVGTNWRKWLAAAKLAEIE